MPRITHETITIEPSEIQAEWRRKSPKPLDIHTTTIHGEDESSERSHTVLYMGMGNEGPRVGAAAAKKLGASGVKAVTIVEALPFWKFAPDQANLMAAAADTADAVAMRIKEEQEADILHAIGESQGTVGTFESMRRAGSPLDGRLGVIHGLGLTPDDLTIRSFLVAMARTIPQNELEGIAALVGAHAARRGLGDAKTRGRQIRSAVGYDGIPALTEIIAGGHEAKGFTGWDDLVFPPLKSQQSIEKRGVEGFSIEIGDGPHASIATRVGAELATRACLWVQNGDSLLASVYTRDLLG